MKYLYLVFAIMVSASFIDRQAIAQNNASSKWIPAGLDTRKSVLLIEAVDFGPGKPRGTARVNELLKGYVEHNYHYDFVYATPDSIAYSTAFADKDKYRYVLTYRYGVYNGYTEMTFYAYHIYDRKENKHYPNHDSPDADVELVYLSALNALADYVENIDEVKHTRH